MDVSVVILTYNSQASIADTIRSARMVSDDIHIVDSFSTDNTVAIARAAGATVIQRPFVNYADQRNWAVDNLSLRHRWQLHLDADEILSEDLVAEIKCLDGDRPSQVDGFIIPRVTKFLGRELRHGGYRRTFHMRLFRNHAARVEDRRYDQHFLLTGISARLNGIIIDDHRMSLSEWTVRHNRWSDFESEEMCSETQARLIQPNLAGNPLERARARRSIYYCAPPFVRAMLLFVYRYVIRMGFLDGMPGLIYCFLQSCWFRFLVDAKIYERRITQHRR